MKTAMKKLLSFVLVAMLLVSAIPFQASAMEGDHRVELYDGEDWKGYAVINGGTVTECTFTPAEKEGYTIKWEKNGVVYNNLAEVPATVDAVGLKYEPIQVTYKIDVYVDGEWKTSVTVNEEGTIISGSLPSTVKDGYTFSGWTFNGGATYTPGMKVTSDCVIGGTFTANPPQNTKTYYTVRFFDANNAQHWSIEVEAGSTIDIADNSTQTQITYAEENVGTKNGYTFKGWQINGKGDVLSTATVAQLSINANTSVYPVFTKNATESENNNNTTNKFPYKVYLHIFKDNKVDEPAKTINITSGIALDGKVTLAEVKSVVKEYYTAKTSDGIGYDGMYLAKGNWVGNFVYDLEKFTTIEDTNEMRKESEVHINVMITNANAKSTTSSSTADSSNPKTGDSIYMVVTVMGLSAAALAAVYYVSKKRAF